MVCQFQQPSNPYMFLWRSQAQQLLHPLKTTRGIVTDDILTSLQPRMNDVRQMLSGLGLSSYSNYILCGAAKEALKTFKKSIPKSIAVPDDKYPFCGSSYLRWPCFDPVIEMKLPVDTEHLSLVGMQVLAHRHLVANVPKSDEVAFKKSQKLCLVWGKSFCILTVNICYDTSPLVPSILPSR